MTGDAGGEQVVLKKSLKLFNCVQLIIGLIIGSGIFISPKGVIQETGSVGCALIVWVVCGIFSIFGAISYSELGCMIPKAGGEYEYLMAAFGNSYAFLFIWSFVIIVFPASFALSALTFADYCLQPFYPTCTPPYYARMCLALASIIFVTIVNCYSIKFTNYLQNACNFGKITGLLMLIGLGFYCLIIGRVENFLNPFENSSTNPTNYAQALYAGIYSFSGWSYLNYVTEEIQDVNRTLPLSIYIGLSIVIFIYGFSNVAYFTLLSPKEMIASSAVAFTFAEKIIGPASSLVSIFVALSSMGFINGGLLASSRTIFGAARNSHMPSFLALINLNYLTPMTSIILMSVLTAICLFIEDVFILLNMAMLAEYIFISATVVGLIWLRRTQPDLKRPIKVNLVYPIVFLLMATAIILMSCLKSPFESFLCLVVVLSGIPIYIIFVKLNKPKSIQDKIAFDESKDE